MDIIALHVKWALSLMADASLSKAVSMKLTTILQIDMSAITVLQIYVINSKIMPVSASPVTNKSTYAITLSGASPERLTPRASSATLSSNSTSLMRSASASTDISLLMEDVKRYVETGKCSTFLATTATIKVATVVPRSAKSKTNTNALTGMPQLRLFAHILESF